METAQTVTVSRRVNKLLSGHILLACSNDNNIGTQGVVWSVSVGRGQSKCWANTGERLEHIVFIAVVELISRTIGKKDITRKLLYADDLAVVADGEAVLQEQLIEWKDMFCRCGLRVSLEKTEIKGNVVGHRRKELAIQLDGKKLKQRDNFDVCVYGVICGDPVRTLKPAEELQQGQSLGGKSKG